MAYIPRPLNTSPSTTMTIRQGGDLINDNFEELADSRNDIEGLQTDVGTLQTDVGTLETSVSTLQTDVGTLETNVSTLQTDVNDIFDGPDFTNMPTVGGDPIVESGSNSDGRWTRWADGTQTCSWQSTGYPFLADSADAVSSGYYSNDIIKSYPQSFITTPDVSCSVIGSTNFMALPATNTRATAINSPRMRFWTPANNTNNTADLSYIAIGRWK